MNLTTPLVDRLTGKKIAGNGDIIFTPRNVIFMALNGASTQDKKEFLMAWGLMQRVTGADIATFDSEETAFIEQRILKTFSDSVEICGLMYDLLEGDGKTPPAPPEFIAEK